MKILLLFVFYGLFNITLLGQSRIITLSPSLNEIVFALGMGDKIVANTLYSNYPKAAQDIPKVGGYSSISVEKILAFKPTVVLSQNYDQNFLRILKELKINTKVFNTSSLSDIKNTIENLGIYFKKEKKAQEINAAIDLQLKLIKNIVINKKILIVISARKGLSQAIYVTNNHIYFEDIINASNNKNAFYSKSTAQPMVNVEKVINMNPDIIILLTPFLSKNKEKQEELIASWSTLPISASSNKNIYTISEFYAGIPSHRVQYFIEDFRKILENVRNK